MTTTEVVNAAGEVVREIREEYDVVLWKPAQEWALGAPHLSCRPSGDMIGCPCGEYHPVYTTAYGLRAECAELDLRWTSLHSERSGTDGRITLGRSVRTWVAEPYASSPSRLISAGRA